MTAKKLPAETKAPAKKNGRPSKLTPELQAAFVQFIKVGLTITLASDAVGVHRVTVHDWLRAGTEDANKGRESDHASFHYAVKKAIAERSAYWLGRMQQGGANWQRFGWLLERTTREEYGRNDKVTVAGDPAAPLGVRIYNLPKEDPE